MRTMKTDVVGEAVSILVRELKVGDKIVKTWARGHEQIAGGKVLKAEKVESIDECAGKWRTHIHVNRRDCYDLRQKVWVIS